MENISFIKVAGVMSLLGAIIITAGVAVGAVALREEEKLEVSSTQRVQKENSNTDNTSSMFVNIKDEDINDEIQFISEYKTTNGERENRDKNLQIACSKINGYEIKPEEVVSFLGIAGPLTKEEGYVDGPIILNQTQIGDGVAGGVCQVSTTLYNAALLANMEIVERARHSFVMEYVPVGMDAVVSEPELDLKIRNTSDTSLYIFASAKGGDVSIQLWGEPPPDGTEIKIESIVKQEFAPEGNEIKFSDELEPGTRQVIQEQRTGYETVVYREYYKDGKRIDRKIISEDIYPAVQGIVLEGKTNTNK